MNYFVFSSPLQCFFASLISKQIEGDSYALYFDFQKSFFEIYPLIIDKVGAKFLSIDKLDDFNLNSFGEKSRLFLPDRYTPQIISFYIKNRKKFSDVSFYEEGTSIYLPAAYFDRTITDSSLSLYVKNLFRRIRHRNPSHIYLREFDNVYTCFPLKLPCKNNVIIKTDGLSRNVNNDQQENECLFLSQCIAIDGFMSLNDYNQCLIRYIESLLKHYKTVYFKLHPRDDESTIRNIDDHFGNKIKYLPSEYNNLPCEIYLLNHPHIDLYSFYSSTLMYYSTLMKGTSFQMLSRLKNDFPDNIRLHDHYVSMNDVFKLHNIKEARLGS